MKITFEGTATNVRYILADKEYAGALARYFDGPWVFEAASDPEYTEEMLEQILDGLRRLNGRT